VDCKDLCPVNVKVENCKDLCPLSINNQTI
jgi:hypothetical protein